MIPTSHHGEPARNDQTARAVANRVSHERLSSREHVARNYRAIALPALAAAVRHVSQLRAARHAATGTSAASADA